MSDSTEKLQNELKAAQRALVEARARYECHDVEQQDANREREENRSALLFMLEDLDNSRKKLEQVHQEWMDALDVIDDPIFLHDKELRVLRCNKAYQKCAGIKFKEIIGHPYYDIFPKTGAPQTCCLRAMEKADEKEGAGAEDEVTLDDTLYRSRAFPIHDERGGYSYSVHILEDITERRKLDEALARSESLLRSITDNSNTVIFVKDLLGRYLFVNRLYETLFHVSDATLRGKTDYDVFPHEMAVAFVKHDQAVTQSGQSVEVEEYVPHDDGIHIYISNKFPLQDSTGKIYAICGVAIDITERKKEEAQLRENEERLRLALAASNQAWFDVNVQTGEAHVSPEYPAMIGFDPEHFQSSMQNWIDNLHPDDHDAVLGAVQVCLASGGPTTIQYRRRTFSGDWLWLHSIAMVVEWDEAQKPLRMIGIHRDISERKLAEAKLTEQLDELKRWQAITLGREDRILTLKREVNELLELADKPPRYPSAEPDERGEMNRG